ncbi:hypothetical protein D3C81_2160330 [compost metagenome]
MCLILIVFVKCSNSLAHRFLQPCAEALPLSSQARLKCFDSLVPLHMQIADRSAVHRPASSAEQRSRQAAQLIQQIPAGSEVAVHCL